MKSTNSSTGAWTVYVGGVYEVTDTGAITKYYGVGGQTIAMRQGTGSPMYLLSDQLGSSTTETDNSGNVIATNRYWPFGSVRTSTGTTPTDRLFTGQRQEPAGDNALGLYNYDARFYSTIAGRFLSVDPVGGSESDPQGWNSYTYVRSNPLRFNDPTGKRRLDEIEADEQQYHERQGLEDLAATGLPGWFWLSVDWDAALSSGPKNMLKNVQEQLGLGVALKHAYGLDDLVWDATPLRALEAIASPDSSLTERVLGVIALARMGRGANGLLASLISDAESAAAMRARGLALEEAAGIVKNNERIPSLTGSARYRIPDEKIGANLREVKAVAYQAFTAQLRDYALWTELKGGRLTLVVREDTKLSKPLQFAVDEGRIDLRRMP